MQVTIKQLELKNFVKQGVFNKKSNVDIKPALQEIAVKCSMKNIENYTKQETEIVNLAQKGRITLEMEQILSKISEIKSQKIIDLQKILTAKDKEPEILKIKQELQENYGAKDLYFDNNIDVAQKVLESAKYLKKQNISLPEQIIFSKFFLGSHCSPMGICYPNKNTVILNPELLEESWSASTDSPLHCFVHECIHNTQTPLFAFQMKKIPAKYKETVDNLSLYASGNHVAEVHAELMTKKVLDKLTPREEELLAFIEGKII